MYFNNNIKAISKKSIHLGIVATMRSELLQFASTYFALLSLAIQLEDAISNTEEQAWW